MENEWTWNAEHPETMVKKQTSTTWLGFRFSRKRSENKFWGRNRKWVICSNRMVISPDWCIKPTSPWVPYFHCRTWRRRTRRTSLATGKIRTAEETASLPGAAKCRQYLNLHRPGPWSRGTRGSSADLWPGFPPPSPLSPCLPRPMAEMSVSENSTFAQIVCSVDIGSKKREGDTLW